MHNPKTKEDCPKEKWRSLIGWKQTTRGLKNARIRLVKRSRGGTYSKHTKISQGLRRIPSKWRMKMQMGDPEKGKKRVKSPPEKRGGAEIKRQNRSHAIPHKWKPQIRRQMQRRGFPGLNNGKKENMIIWKGNVQQPTGTKEPWGSINVKR